MGNIPKNVAALEITIGGILAKHAWRSRADEFADTRELVNAWRMQAGRRELLQEIGVAIRQAQTAKDPQNKLFELFDPQTTDLLHIAETLGDAKHLHDHIDRAISGKLSKRDLTKLLQILGEFCPR